MRDIPVPSCAFKGGREEGVLLERGEIRHSLVPVNGMHRTAHLSIHGAPHL